MVPVETLVYTVLPCSISMITAPLGPTVPEPVVAFAFVKVTVPKLAKGTKEPFSSKSSTIHSASFSQRAAVEVSALVTVLPVETLVMVALPALL